MTWGTPVEADTFKAISSAEYGFFHRHGQMQWHWDPAVQSIYEYAYPLWLEVEYYDPHEIEYYNNTTVRIIWDVSIWQFECATINWHYVRDYIRGMYAERIEKYQKMRHLFPPDKK